MSIRKTHNNEDFLTGNELLDTLSTPEQRRMLQKYSLQRLYGEKEILFYDFHIADYAYVIQLGKVRLWKMGMNGQSHTMGFASTGDVIGCRGCLNEDHYRLSATAIEASEICLIPKEIFCRLIQGNDALCIQILRHYTRKLERLEDRLMKMAEMNAREKVADAFVLLKNKFGYRPNSTKLNIKLSRKDIASIAGVSKDSVVKQLSEFRKDRIIDYKGRSITILEFDKLQEISAP